MNFLGRTLVICLAGLSFAVLWLSSAPATSADHYRYVAHNADIVDFPGEHNNFANGLRTWVMKPWALDGQTVKYCNGMADTPYNQSILDAVANWNMQFSFPWIDFTAYCGVSQKMDIVDDRWGTGPCIDNYVGCTEVVSWYQDFTRNGYYIDYARVWIHYPHWQFDAYWGIRQAVAHEIGHVYGLDDKYIHGGGCNGALPSTVMDGSVTNAQGQISGGCDWNGPTSADNADITWFYYMNATNAQHEVMPSVKLNSTQIKNPWRDHSPSEKSYTLSHQYIWQNNVITYATSVSNSGLAAGDPWAVTNLEQVQTKPPNTPSNTFYRSCINLYNAIIGNQYERCFNWQFLEG